MKTTPDDSMPVDWNVALDLLQGDRDLLRTITVLAMQEIPKLHGNIRRSIEAKDPKALHIAAHTLKGTVGYFGAHQVVECARRIETAGREGDFSAASTHLETLDTLIPPVLDAMKQL